MPQANATKSFKTNSITLEQKKLDVKLDYSGTHFENDIMDDALGHHLDYLHKIRSRSKADRDYELKEAKRQADSLFTLRNMISKAPQKAPKRTNFRFKIDSANSEVINSGDTATSEESPELNDLSYMTITDKSDKSTESESGSIDDLDSGPLKTLSMTNVAKFANIWQYSGRQGTVFGKKYSSDSDDSEDNNEKDGTRYRKKSESSSKEGSYSYGVRRPKAKTPSLSLRQLKNDNYLEKKCETEIQTQKAERKRIISERIGSTSQMQNKVDAFLKDLDDFNRKPGGQGHTVGT